MGAAACSGSTTGTGAGGAGTGGTGSTPGSNGVTVGGTGKVGGRTTGVHLPVDASAAAANPQREDRTATSAWANTGPEVQHLHFTVGPIDIKSGQNNIAYTGADIPRPDRDGYIVGIHPDLKYADGRTPGVDDVHLHHAVWVNLSGKDPTAPGLPERFFAAGEEKTIMRSPAGYGYPYKTTDMWLLNYMIHNLWPEQKQVWVVYDIDFIPADAASAKGIKAAHPLWLDVQNGNIYPVFDALKGTGTDGIFTFPDDKPDPYGVAAASAGSTTTTAAAGDGTDTTQRRRRGPGGYRGPPRPSGPLNVWTVDKDMTLIGTGAHLHPGGIYSDLVLRRSGATADAASGAAAVADGDAVRLFRSEAVYYEPAGAVSWDLSMTATPPDWRVGLRQGDQLVLNATYDVSKASWYESMGIMVAWVSDETGGPDPFAVRVDRIGQVSHGHLPENDNHGGDTSAGNRTGAGLLPDMTKLTQTVDTDKVDIKDYVYAPGDMANYDVVPQVKPGGKLRFNNIDSPLENGIWHTITACKAPCNLSTGIAYPLADGDTVFDSGQLGEAGPPTAGRTDWTVPTDLTPGLYTYFCRVHPFMRGAFKVAQ